MNRLLLLFLLILQPHLFQAQSYDIVIRDVNVVDVRRGRILENQTVCIQGDKIVRIEKSGTIHSSRQSMEGNGKFLIPGLWDMHTHNWWNIHFSELYVRNGVTGVRNMYTPMHLIGPLKDSIQNKQVIGPKYYAAGRVLEGKKPDFPDWIVVDSKEKVGPALDTLQMEGSDFVKVYNKIPRDVYFELMRQAKSRNMRVEGHLPMQVTAREASDAGQRSFEHLLGIPDMCTKEQLFANKHEFNWFAALMREDDYGRLMIDPKVTKRAFKTLRKNKTYVCPTLTVLYNYLHPDTRFEDDPNLSRIPAEVAQYWSGAIASFRAKDSTYKEMALRKYQTFKKVTLLLYESGVPMIAGTDAINPFCYPGFSLHRELELLQDCGIPDADILKMATLNPAEFTGFTEYGEVAVGKKASLVLLNKNPLEDIRNTRSIAQVIVEGTVIAPF